MLDQKGPRLWDSFKGKSIVMKGRQIDILPGKLTNSPWEGNGNPLQWSCLKNPRDGGAWWAAIYGLAQSRTRLKRLSSSSSSTLRNTEYTWVIYTTLINMMKEILSKYFIFFSFRDSSNSRNHSDDPKRHPLPTTIFKSKVHYYQWSFSSSSWCCCI